MEKSRVSSEEREEKILMLLNRLPGRFSIKEISDIYDSLDSQSLNRNSLRKTLTDLVERNKINCTRNGNSSKGHGAYFGLSSNDFFRRVAKSLPQVESVAKSVGASFVERSFQEIFANVGPAQCAHETAEDVTHHIKYSYPFIDFTFEDEKRSMAVSTKIAVNLPDSRENDQGYDPRDTVRHFDIVIDQCLCNGESRSNKTMENACHMVSGAIEAGFTPNCGYNAEVSKTNSLPNGVCEYRVTLNKQKPNSSSNDSKYDLDDPIERNHAIPSL